MTKPFLTASVLVVACGIAGIVSAQTPGVPADLPAAIEARKTELAKQSGNAGGGFTITPQSLSESRNANGRGSMTLTYTAVGTDVLPGTSIRQANITNAVDDKDRSLLPDPPPGGRFSPPLNLGNLAAAAGRGGAVPLRGTIQLVPAERDAKSVKLVEGSMDVYSPTKSSEAVLTFTGLQGRTGKPLEELTKYGIEVTLLDAASFSELAPKIAAVAPGYVPNFGPGSVVLFIKDPKSLFVGYAFKDGIGAPLQQTGGTFRGGADGMVVETILRNPVVPATRLLLYIALPETVTTVPLKLENIALP